MHKRDAVDACVKAPERLQHVVDESRKVTGGFILHSVIDTKFSSDKAHPPSIRIAMPHGAWAKSKFI